MLLVETSPKRKTPPVTQDAISVAEVIVETLSDRHSVIAVHLAEESLWREFAEVITTPGLTDSEKVAQIDCLATKKGRPLDGLLTSSDTTPLTKTLEKVTRLAEFKIRQSTAARTELTGQIEPLRLRLSQSGVAHDSVTGDFEKPVNHSAWATLTAILQNKLSASPELAQELLKIAGRSEPFASVNQVLDAERREIECRRKRLKPREAKSRRASSETPPPPDFFGVALSGGGIRSATFNLGVLQAFAHFKLLSQIDILSTVSGGGYIGAWLAAWIHKEKNGIKDVEAKLPTKSCEEIGFLRQFSNYLTPSRGLFSLDSWTMAAVYIRNVALNQVTLAAIIGSLMLLPRFTILAIHGHTQASANTWVDNWIVYTAVLAVALSVSLIGLNLRRATAHKEPNSTLRNQERRPQGFRKYLTKKIRFLGSFSEVGVQVGCVSFMLLGVSLASVWFWLNLRNDVLKTVDAGPFWCCALGFFFFLSLTITLFGRSFQCVERRLKAKSAASRIWAYALLVVAMLISSSVAVASLRGFLAVLAAFQSNLPAGEWHAVVWSPLLLMLVPSCAAILHVGLLGVDFEDAGREWLTRFRAITHLWLFFWTALCCAAIYGPRLFALLGRWPSGGVGIVWLLATLASLKAAQSILTGKTKEGKPRGSYLQLLAKVGPPLFLVGFLLLISLAEHLLLSYPKLGWEIFSKDTLNQKHWSLLYPDSMWSGHHWHWGEPGTLLLLLLGTGVILAWRVDINEFSMHHFYKNRLVRCYLGASRKRDPNPFTGFDQDDDMPLHSLKPSQGYTGPYHIFNTTLNLSAGRQLAWQERKGASFILTPAYCGFDLSLESKEGGVPQNPDKLSSRSYRETCNYAYPGGIHLGTAAAISGAAADPNQGYNTSPAVAFLMTVFDVRLGWWLGNPRRAAESKLPGPRFGLTSLLSELIGRTDNRTRFVSLSDGGHFDNLGLYELVRRRCKYIVVCDAEQDSQYHFGGLGMAIRKCRIDFGAEIDIDPSAIIPSGVPKRSRSHCAVGTIRYEDGEQGTLLYIKAALTGDEPKDVLQYAASEPAFPHETTANQWFTESQFESYRALGYAAAQAAIRPAWTPQKSLACLFAKPEPLDGCSCRVHCESSISLRDYWFPDRPGLHEHATKHTGTLSQLLTMIAGNKGLHDLGAKLFPVQKLLASGSLQNHEEFYFVMVLLQLVEDIYFDLQLERNDWKRDPKIAGWRTLFESWASSSIVQEVWTKNQETFREDFRVFWNDLQNERRACATAASS